MKGYDEKYNMAEEDQFETKDKEQEEERQKMDSERGRKQTTLNSVFKERQRHFWKMSKRKQLFSG